jgi:DNA-binding MarR family transcriptional regulator
VGLGDGRIVALDATVRLGSALYPLAIALPRASDFSNTRKYASVTSADGAHQPGAHASVSLFMRFKTCDRRLSDMYMHVDDGMVMKAQIAGVDLNGTGTCAAFNLRRASRVVTQLYDAGLAATGVRSTQFTILVALAKTQPASIGALAETTLMDQTTMTRNLRLMARLGLVDVPARGAKREKLVRLTAKGERMLAKAVPVWRGLQERFVDAFGKMSWREMRRDLELAAVTAMHMQRVPVARGPRNVRRYR